ncbi:Solute carrier family 13 member 5 [Durusdinium trenchii]|uniref:Solute carrier family 13 member 5 n=1 Tax=Durusdinium trenchii TaxID=1381693 RepID=A0ABP0SJ10_9DINO
MEQDAAAPVLRDLFAIGEIARWTARRRRAWAKRKSNSGEYLYVFTATGQCRCGALTEAERTSLLRAVQPFLSLGWALDKEAWGLIACAVAGAMRTGRQCRDFFVLFGQDQVSAVSAPANATTWQSREAWIAEHRNIAKCALHTALGRKIERTVLRNLHRLARKSREAVAPPTPSLCVEAALEMTSDNADRRTVAGDPVRDAPRRQMFAAAAEDNAAVRRDESEFESDEEEARKENSQQQARDDAVTLDALQTKKRMRKRKKKKDAKKRRLTKGGGISDDMQDREVGSGHEKAPEQGGGGGGDNNEHIDDDDDDDDNDSIDIRLVQEDVSSSSASSSSSSSSMSSGMPVSSRFSTASSVQSLPSAKDEDFAVSESSSDDSGEEGLFPSKRFALQRVNFKSKPKRRVVLDSSEDERPSPDFSVSGKKAHVLDGPPEAKVEASVTNPALPSSVSDPQRRTDSPVPAVQEEVLWSSSEEETAAVNKSSSEDEDDEDEFGAAEVEDRATAGHENDNELNEDGRFLHGWDDEEMAERPHAMEKGEFKRLMSLKSKPCRRKLDNVLAKLGKALAFFEKRVIADLPVAECSNLQDVLQERVRNRLLDVSRVLLRRFEELDISEMKLVTYDSIYRDYDERVSRVSKRLQQMRRRATVGEHDDRDNRDDALDGPEEDEEEGEEEEDLDNRDDLDQFEETGLQRSHSRASPARSKRRPRHEKEDSVIVLSSSDESDKPHNSVARRARASTHGAKRVSLAAKESISNSSSDDEELSPGELMSKVSRLTARVERVLGNKKSFSSSQSKALRKRNLGRLRTRLQNLRTQAKPCARRHAGARSAVEDLRALEERVKRAHESEPLHASNRSSSSSGATATAASSTSSSRPQYSSELGEAGSSNAWRFRFGTTMDDYLAEERPSVVRSVESVIGRFSAARVEERRDVHREGKVAEPRQTRLDQFFSELVSDGDEDLDEEGDDMHHSLETAPNTWIRRTGTDWARAHELETLRRLQQDQDREQQQQQQQEQRQQALQQTSSRPQTSARGGLPVRGPHYPVRRLETVQEHLKTAESLNRMALPAWLVYVSCRSESLVAPAFAAVETACFARTPSRASEARAQLASFRRNLSMLWSTAQDDRFCAMYAQRQFALDWVTRMAGMAASRPWTDKFLEACSWGVLEWGAGLLDEYGLQTLATILLSDLVEIFVHKRGRLTLAERLLWRRVMAITGEDEGFWEALDAVLDWSVFEAQGSLLDSFERRELLHKAMKRSRRIGEAAATREASAVKDFCDALKVIRQGRAKSGPQGHLRSNNDKSKPRRIMSTFEAIEWQEMVWDIAMMTVSLLGPRGSDAVCSSKHRAWRIVERVLPLSPLMSIKPGRDGLNQWQRALEWQQVDGMSLADYTELLLERMVCLGKILGPGNPVFTSSWNAIQETAARDQAWKGEFFTSKKRKELPFFLRLVGTEWKQGMVQAVTQLLPKHRVKVMAQAALAEPVKHMETAFESTQSAAAAIAKEERSHRFLRNLFAVAVAAARCVKDDDKDELRLLCRSVVNRTVDLKASDRHARSIALDAVLELLKIVRAMSVTPDALWTFLLGIVMQTCQEMAKGFDALRKGVESGSIQADSKCGAFMALSDAQDANALLLKRCLEALRLELRGSGSLNAKWVQTAGSAIRLIFETSNLVFTHPSVAVSCVDLVYATMARCTGELEQEPLLPTSSDSTEIIFPPRVPLAYRAPQQVETPHDAVSNTSSARASAVAAVVDDEDDDDTFLDMVDVNAMIANAQQEKRQQALRELDARVTARAKSLGDPEILRQLRLMQDCFGVVLRPLIALVLDWYRNRGMTSVDAMLKTRKRLEADRAVKRQNVGMLCKCCGFLTVLGMKLRISGADSWLSSMMLDWRPWLEGKSKVPLFTMHGFLVGLDRLGCLRDFVPFRLLPALSFAWVSFALSGLQSGPRAGSPILLRCGQRLGLYATVWAAQGSATLAVRCSEVLLMCDSSEGNARRMTEMFFEAAGQAWRDCCAAARGGLEGLRAELNEMLLAVARAVEPSVGSGALLSRALEALGGAALQGRQHTDDAVRLIFRKHLRFAEGISKDQLLGLLRVVVEARREDVAQSLVARLAILRQRGELGDDDLIGIPDTILERLEETSAFCERRGIAQQHQER